jgi:plasmid stabilization system protein ParE
LTAPLRIDISLRAVAQIEEAAAWWIANRPAAPGAIGQEIERGFSLLSIQPSLGARALNVRLRGIRRLHLSRVHYHLYYRVRGQVVEVLAFWHTSRGRPPRVGAK